MKSFKQKMKEKAEREEAERLIAEAKAEDARKWEDWYHERELEQQRLQEQQEEIAQREAYEYEVRMRQRLLREQEIRQRPKPIDTRLLSKRSFTWQAFANHPKIINLPMPEKVRLFKLAQAREIDRINQQPVLGSSPADAAVNYALSFTGDTKNDPRADLVTTDFTPNDPTNKGFAADSGRIPLAKSGFTISYWYRPDETANDAFAMGWKREDTARFSFGMRNAARPYFGIGSNTFGTYGSHNAWYNMFNESGNTDLTDKYIDDSDNLIADGSNWYHIAITFTGREPGGTAINETEWYRRIYFNGKQIYGQNDEAIGTAYNDWHNVDRTGAISWPEGHLDARMSRGFSFGMRALKGTGNYVASDGETIKISKYNNGHACGLDDVAIYNELKDNDWVRSVYNGGTGYNHKDSGGDGLVAYWKFNEGDGTTVKDLGPYGYHGTLTNAAVGEGDDITVQTAIGNIAEGTPTWNDMSKENR